MESYSKFFVHFLYTQWSTMLPVKLLTNYNYNAKDLALGFIGGHNLRECATVSQYNSSTQIPVSVFFPHSSIVFRSCLDRYVCLSGLPIGPRKSLASHLSPLFFLCLCVSIPGKKSHMNMYMHVHVCTCIACSCIACTCIYMHSMPVGTCIDT